VKSEVNSKCCVSYGKQAIGASATDCSRIAWLFLNLKDEKKASEYAEIGLRLDGDNEHCVKIARRLRII
jgi:hypothetical protein